MSYPDYKCHKIVKAFKVGKIEGCTIFPIDESLPPYQATPEFIGRHGLNMEGYVVFYEDGYVSFSPAESFESGYSEIVKLDYKQRVVAERDELGEKLIKLTAFINGGEPFDSLSQVNKYFLMEQQGYMRGYANMLTLRIESF